MPKPRFTLVCDSPDATAHAARTLAQMLRPGDTVLLSGDLGTGKTHFARAAIQSLLDMPEDVPSPSYTLVQTYPGRHGEIWHADLYRLGDISEVVELGLEDAFDTAITLIEWPDRLGDLTPAQALSIGIEAQEAEDARMLTFEWSDPKWPDKLKGLRHD